MRRKITSVLAIIITAGALYFSFRNTDTFALIQYVLDGKYIYVLPAFIAMMLYVYLRAVRWNYFFEIKVSTRLLFSTTMIGLMTNAVFPARAGEFLKAYLLGKRSGISKSACLATVVLERLWDGIALLIFTGFLFIWVLLNGSAVLGKNANIPLIRYAASMSIILYILILALILIWKYNSVKMAHLIRKIISKFSMRLGDYAYDRLAAFNQGLGIFNSKKNIILVTIYSLLIWLLAAIILFFMFKVYALQLPFAASFILVILIALFVMIPSIGSLGTMQLAFVLGLAMYDIDKNKALSFSLLYQFFDTVPIVILGLIFFLRDGFSFRQASFFKEEKK